MLWFCPEKFKYKVAHTKHKGWGVMPKRKGKLRKDEVVHTNFISGERKIKRIKKFKIKSVW